MQPILFHWSKIKSSLCHQFCQIQFILQVYSSKKLYELYSTPAGWRGADDSFIQNRIDDLPKWIRGISSQALADFSDILTEFRNNCIVLGITGDIVSSSYLEVSWNLLCFNFNFVFSVVRISISHFEFRLWESSSWWFSRISSTIWPDKWSIRGIRRKPIDAIEWGEKATNSHIL